MNTKQSKYETLYNIKLPEFYHFIIDVMADFNYSLYRTVKEVENKRRIELWIQAGDDDYKAMVWIELLPPGEHIDPYLTTDVLRAMNEEDVTRLFFFTNGILEKNDRDVLEGHQHFIFTTEEIVEKLTAMEANNTVKIVKKRKEVKTPSGSILIKNFFKRSEIKRKQIHLRLSATPDLAEQYTRLVRRVLTEVDNVEDINEIPPRTRELLKKIQFDLLPELSRTSSFIFPRQFNSLRNTLFNIIQHTIIYIGNFVEYEAEDDLKHNRDIIEELLKKVDEVGEHVLSYKAELIHNSEKYSVANIIKSTVISVVAIVILLIIRMD